MKSTVRLAALAAFSFLAAACGGSDNGGTGPDNTPLGIEAATATSFSATVGAAVASLPSVRVLRGTTPVAGVPVTFAVVSGGGSATGLTRTTDASGVATVGSWTLGSTAGANGMTAIATGVATAITFTATGTAAAPASVSIANGSGQSATAGATVAIAPSVKVADQYGNGVSGIGVTFSVLSGGGSVTGATTTTNASGLATVGSWTLGSTAGANQLQASVTGLAPAVFGATAVAASASQYAIDLRFIGPAPATAVQTAFTNAAARWQQVITGDIPDNPLLASDTIPAGTCGNNPALTGPFTLDDIIIYAEVDSIDGPGQILGEASPCYIESGTDLRTIMGYMHFDSADMQTMIANGTIGDVILHEMGHVLGIGTLWDASLSRAQTSASDTSWIRLTDVRHLGTASGVAFSAMGGSGGVPVENCAAGVPTSCGPGTWLGHWREATFRNELMTGYISGTGNPLSRVTIGALADIGYSVNPAAADSYTYPPTSASFSGSVATGVRLNELPPGAVYTIVHHGKPRRVR